MMTFKFITVIKEILKLVLTLIILYVLLKSLN
jgi:hypothetical protein